MENLTLPEPVASLWVSKRHIIHAIPPEMFRSAIPPHLGGGTTLAARWQHRLSFTFRPDPSYGQHEAAVDHQLKQVLSNTQIAVRMAPRTWGAVTGPLLFRWEPTPDYVRARVGTRFH